LELEIAGDDGSSESEIIGDIDIAPCDKINLSATESRLEDFLSLF
jgi:hypothetical protein